MDQDTALQINSPWQEMPDMEAVHVRTATAELTFSCCICDDEVEVNDLLTAIEYTAKPDSCVCDKTMCQELAYWHEVAKRGEQ